jgi:nucleotide-binding universal stress UspA family protein
MFSRILLATDGSPVVERMVIYAGHLARIEQAEVIVLHAYDPPARYADYEGYDLLLERYQAVAQTLVAETVDELIADGVQARGEVRAGPAAEVIIAAALEHEAMLIIMGTRGSSNLREMLGSVSTQVLRYAHCPVLEVP